MDRNILLVEPAYSTKFPPLGLMKISAYHKLLGDKVHFVKGIDHNAAYEYWDRIYVATLFTYYWKVTVETIKHYKNLVGGDTSRIFVGGILATLMPEELWKATGVFPITGLLNNSGVLDIGTDHIVEEMIPDYRLFDGSQQNYALVPDTYFGYATRGCVRKCKFCGVPQLEPEFMDYRGIKPYIEGIKSEHKEKTHLVLLDNNVLASKSFNRIISDMIDLGFGKGAKVGYKNKAAQMTYKHRHVDFNQGTDARLLTESHVRLLSKIALHPLRIAFDSIRLKEIYSDKIALAAKYGITHLSNYILYNFNDTPEDFWQRLKINIDLNKKYGLKIYSFPMKYIPLNAKDRTYVDEPRWNWYFIRSVQRILNVVKGSVMTGEEFFFRAFGENESQFQEILFMPERILMYRGSQPKSEETEWRNRFGKLSQNEKNELLTILNMKRTAADLRAVTFTTRNRKLRAILDYYPPHSDQDEILALFRATKEEGF